MKGKITYKEQVYAYELDKEGFVWITKPSTIGKINIGQVKSLSNSDDIISLVIEMLNKGGY